MGLLGDVIRAPIKITTEVVKEVVTLPDTLAEAVEDVGKALAGDDG